MQYYERELANELEYFQKTIALVKTQLEKKLETSERSRGNLLSSRKEMWDEAAHSSDDFDNVVEISQYLEELNMKTASYLAGTNEIQKLEKMQDSPYFARVDFREADTQEKEKIYIGRYSLIDDDTHNMYVFDWRSPIAGIFYRYELGQVQYQAPGGIIRGNVSLKRQYEIKRGKFEYFFDANVQIVDEFLRKMLSKNASSRMTSIVETIQKDQDIIIRDSKNELLMVQGVAGSGKTSVALHRVAYLMYQGLSSKLSSNNIAILSPNALFAKYISNVLPELGEDNVETLTFEEICNQVFGKGFQMAQTRNQFFEQLITCTIGTQKDFMKSSMEFKASNTFVTMLKRLVTYYERKLIPFGDVAYNHQQLFDRHLLKAKLLNGDARTPIALRLKQIETMILQEIRKESKFRLAELEWFIDKYPDHIYESQAFARMLSIRENRILLACIRKFTEIDYEALYRKMFHDKNLFYALAKGLELPENMEEIRLQTDELLSLKSPQYEDALAIAFLKIKLAGCDSYKNIKQVVIDEVQDYYPIHFEILSLLFPKAKYTVLGDVNQTIEKQTALTFYEDVERILDKKSSALLTLSKSFRCTNQIIAFSTKFITELTRPKTPASIGGGCQGRLSPVWTRLTFSGGLNPPLNEVSFNDKPVKQECFSRDGVLPEIIYGANRADLDEGLKEFIESMKEQGYKSICILCKSLKESAALYSRIKNSTDVVLMDDTFITELSGTFIIPIYMAKGLEFDAVLVYDVDDTHYRSADDKKLLYIASTRALHRLALFYMGKQSRFLIESE
ncbi:HelD family protein [Lutispora sp.]|nr:UvrD-helicase domain-containing protein [Lutispora sp.]MEA4960966.1 AAA family ATPase [Lutispora sp.]